MRPTVQAILICIVAVVCLPGCGAFLGGVNGSGKVPPSLRDREPPEIRAVSITPTTVDFAGAPVTLQARVMDPSGVHSVWATVEPADPSWPLVGLVKVSGQTYQGVWNVPANVARDAVTKVYTVKVTAWDVYGNSGSSDAVTVTSMAPVAPPPPPVVGE